MPRVRNTLVVRERRTATFVEDAALPLPISSFPTLDSIPQSARHQRKAASRHSVPGSSSAPAHIPRPRNAYVLYRSWALSYHPSIAGAKASNKQDVLSKLTGELWNAESDEVRAHFATLAAEEKDRHAERYPEYSYMPKHGEAEKVGRKRSVVTSRRVGKKKSDDDDDDYTPNLRSRPSLASNHHYTPHAPPSFIPEDLLARSPRSRSVSMNSIEEYRSSVASEAQRADEEVTGFSTTNSPPNIYLHDATDPAFEPSSPSVFSSTSSGLSEGSTFLDSLIEDMPTQTFAYSTYPISNIPSSPSAMSTYASPEELSSRLNCTQNFEDLFATFVTTSDSFLFADQQCPTSDRELSCHVSVPEDEDVFRGMMDTYMNL